MMNVRSLILGGSLASVLGLVALAGCGGSGNSNSPHVYSQIDRLARPAVNEVFATVANNRHAINDTATPSQDGQPGFLIDDIQTFMTTAAGRSQATTDVVKAVLVPDVMVADLSQTGPAAYLGVETGGATGGTFGGRKLTDDVVDTSLGVIFGNTVSALGLAPDDGKEIPTLTTDNVGYTTAPKHYQDGVVSAATFPYLGPAQ
jgi:hypothetical protein